MTDPYVAGELGHARLFKTKYVANDLNPTWDETFNVYVCHHANSLRLHVKDKEHVGAAWIASCDVRCQDLLERRTVEGWFDLTNGDKVQGRINISVTFTPKEELEGERELAVPGSYFPARENCRVILYQDAHTPQLPCVSWKKKKEKKMK